ncbi:MAG: maturase [Planctomycetes bacterium]|nr:maturase [Planctomycetota bacterium]
MPAQESVVHHRFQYREDAERFLAELRQRFRKFSLELHPTKTRLMEFGRYAARDRQRRAEGKLESLDFFGFTHSCDKTRNGKFIVLRQTIRKRMRAKLREIKFELRRHMHHPTPEVGQWLRSVLTGHFRYYAVPRNQRKLSAFKYQVHCLWFRTLRRRSQRHRISGERMNRLAARWFPPVRVLHPYPEQRLRVMT